MSLAPIQALNQWLVVLLAPQPNGRTEKYPLNSATGQPHDAHDPAIWLTHAQATATATAWGSQFTVGFVLTAPDPFWCLDIDAALQPDGTWSALSIDLCKSLPNTCVEVSQSGRGLHIWGQGPVPPHSKKNVPLHIELYTERRFIAIGTDAIGDMTRPCPSIAASNFRATSSAPTSPTGCMKRRRIGCSATTATATATTATTATT